MFSPRFSWKSSEGLSRRCARRAAGAVGSIALALLAISCGLLPDPGAAPVGRDEGHSGGRGESGTAAAAGWSATRARIERILVGAHRSEQHRARDGARHPLETLAWFGVREDSTVVELWPGSAGWYTEVLAPLLRERGHYIAAGFARGGESEFEQRANAEFAARLAARPDLYDRAELRELAPGKLAIAEPNSADFVLTFRNVHNWMASGFADDVFAAAFRALRPGGVLGVVEHRARVGRDQDPAARSGYVREDHVVALARAAGFEQAGRSEINANPADDTEHPQGVWTLPPTLALGDRERVRWASIGESDRMTLKFRKPADAGRRAAIAPDDFDTVSGWNGAVSSAEANASRIGIGVLQRGGNAIDAAVAIAFALGVTHPSAGNIGGGGFMVVRFPDGRATAIDYRETAPGRAHRDMYLDESGAVTRRGRVGALAAGIPGNVAGLAHAHARYGSRPWRELVEPSLRLARDGYVLDEFHARDLAYATRKMDEHGYADSAALFRKPDGSAYAAGDVWKQPALAETLAKIAQGGAEAFYRGPLAEHMARAVRKLGGIWTAQDLADYRVVERAPLEFDFRGHRFVAMPPPSAGGVVLRQILAASEALGLEQLDWDSAERAHLYVETLRRTYADRNQLIGDPAFVDVPMAELLDTRYVDERVAGIDPERATPSSEIGAGLPVRAESPQTTHFSVVDAQGTAVANTYTLNGGFGAKLVIPGTGVILNNEMDDFTAKPGTPNMFGLVQGPQNAIEPGKRMLSSMTPTIIARDGKLRAVLGSPGGPTITTTVAQIAMQVIDHQRSISEAVRATRIHHQWLPDMIWHEPELAPELAAALRERGHALRTRGRIGHANCIEVDPATGAYRAVADEARDGGRAFAY